MQDHPGALETSIPLPVLHQAAEWLLRLREGDMDTTERSAWQHWLAASELHARAWSRAERLAGLLDDVPGVVGSVPLRNAKRARPSRRAVLSAFVGLLIGAPLARLAWQREPWQRLQADLATAIGERRDASLGDGSRLTLNTDTRVAVAFDDHRRVVRLLRGELQVQTAADPQQPARPFVVQVPQGRLLALGTRFALRLWDDHVRVAVEAGSVQINLADAGAQPLLVRAGQQALFTAASLLDIGPLQRNSVAWTRGIVQAQAMPLGELLAELARYRNGIVRCDPDVAALPVSGVFQLDDTDTVLKLLQAALPLRVRYRSRLWVVVEAA